MKLTLKYWVQYLTILIFLSVLIQLVGGEVGFVFGFIVGVLINGFMSLFPQNKDIFGEDY